jgi:predicted amino acid-binding ACT domain protein
MDAEFDLEDFEIDVESGISLYLLLQIDQTEKTLNKFNLDLKTENRSCRLKVRLQRQQKIKLSG